jgi:hypothetical protein
VVLIRGSGSGADIHAESAPAEVEEALRFVGDELRGDLEEAAAGIDDDAGFALATASPSVLRTEGELLGDNGGTPAGPPGNLGDHERAAVGQLTQDLLAGDSADVGKNGCVCG